MSNLYRVGNGTNGSPTDLNQLVDALSGVNDVGAITAFAPISPPSALGAAINTTSGNLNGTYQYKVSLVTGYWQGPVGVGTLYTQGITGGGLVSNSISPSSQQANLSNIPIGGTGVVGRVIYRTKANGSTFYFLQQINDNVTTSWIDNVNDASLTVPMPSVNTTGSYFSGDGRELKQFDQSTGHRHTGAAGDAPKIDSAGLANGAVTDTVIGSRTATDSVTPSFTGQLTPLVSSLFTLLKGVTGKPSALTAPALTLETVSSYLNQSVKTGASPTFANVTSGATMTANTDLIVNPSRAIGQDQLQIKGNTMGSNYPNMAFSLLNSASVDTVVGRFALSPTSMTAGAETGELHIRLKAPGDAIGITSVNALRVGGNGLVAGIRNTLDDGSGKSIFSGIMRVGNSSLASFALGINRDSTTGGLYDSTKPAYQIQLNPAASNRFEIQSYNSAGVNVGTPLSILGMAVTAGAQTIDDGNGNSTFGSTGIMSMGNRGGERFYLYNAGAGNTRMGFGVDVTGNPNEMTIFGSNVTQGRISFGFRDEGTAAYTQRMLLTPAELQLGVNSPANTNRKTLRFNPGGWGEPGAYDNDSYGDKIVLMSASPASYDGRIGIGSTANMWFKSSGVNGGNSGSFDFYTGQSVTKKVTIDVGGLTIYGNYVATGTKSAVVPTMNYDDQLLFAMESPENRFEDFYETVLNVNGHAIIEMDSIFLETVEIYGDDYQVYVQGNVKGDYAVTERNATNFVVEGEPNAIVMCRIIAWRYGYKDLRFNWASIA